MLNTINRKVMAGYAVVFLILVIAVSLLLQRSGSIENTNSEFVENTLPKLHKTESAKANLSQLQIAAFALYGTTIDETQFSKLLKDHHKQIKQDISSLKTTTSANLKLSDKLNRVIQDINQLSDIMSARRVDWDGARDALSSLQKSADNLHTALGKLNKNLSQQASQGAKQVKDRIDSMRLLIILAIIGITIVIAGAFLMANAMISKPVKRLSLALDRIALEHDLTHQIKNKSNDEIGAAATSINHLLSGFRDGTSEIMSASTSLQESVGLLNHSATVSDEQVVTFAHHIEELKNKINTLESSINDSSNRSFSASETAKTGANQVKQGAIEVSNTAKGIGELSTDIESSAEMLLNLKNAGDQVSSVVKTIAEIAEQTNLLALNAAIEAARAGESGRGFAVVADEVRTLASRTHDSTHEINSILDTIVNSISSTVSQMESNKTKAQDAVSLAESTVAALDIIQTTVIQLSEENETLARLAQTNKDDTDAMNSSVSQMESASHLVTESSRETKEASNDLTSLASALNAITSRYKI